MTVLELIHLLSEHTERRAVYISLLNSTKVYEIDEDYFLFFSENERDRNQSTNKTTPLVLMGKE